MKTFAAIAFTPAVRALQQAHGSRAAYAGIPDELPFGGGLGTEESAFLQAADTAFLASVNTDGWPYVQHRGGPPGFLRVLAPDRIAFADYRGNRQYVSVGNANGDRRVAMIVMDYAHRRRLKLFGRLRFEAIEGADPTLLAAVTQADYRARIERIATLEVEAFDWNCPQHIRPRFSTEETVAVVRPLQERIAQLEQEIATLRGQQTSP